MQVLKEGVLPKGRALVPGCGRAYAVVAFAQHGYTATGLDLSETAVEEAQQVLEENRASLQGEATVALGNFFETTGTFDVIYDYTFLCALHPDARAAWAQQHKKLLAPGGTLFTMIYPITEKTGGPPFQMSIELVQSLLEPLGFKASRLEMLPDELCHPGREGKTAIGLWQLSEQ
ncbi:uncharacterized protein MONBRDRAFT_28218 [Monosiga brevicollis MX1]|uniref:Thiopurine S-methyltransferase n=1 Tax=Monosiga brevicollis TaxID=81824 RepID=A9V7J4_MONBE|nr:uncharacterized protein MONBRDRAFT_28218 [Monosiga brevicollis MX1]EDQ86526.1 predicted protein [Monosiga brevicollis MX1]|eukprot:XP_001748639.1 hypothetical protein [Monosiga brevicollis MX1]